MRGKNPPKAVNVYAPAMDANRCFDPARSIPRNQKIKCNCQDPTRAVPRTRKTWTLQHRRIASLSNSTQNCSVAVFGDSIVERLGGTKLLGTEKSPIKGIFKNHFPGGVALGASGDSSPELLWHLKKGWLAADFQPKVMVLLIGTNDLGRHGCNKEHTLAGVLNVADFLQKERPRTRFVVHGILPRFDPKTKKLGRYHRDILWVNAHLADVANSTAAKWSYMDSTETFLDPKLFEDGLHPNAQGYRVWLARVAAQMRQLHRSQ